MGTWEKQNYLVANQNIALIINYIKPGKSIANADCKQANIETSDHIVI